MKQDIPLGVYKLRVLRLEIDTLKRYLVGPQQEMSKIIDAGHSSACVLFKLTPASPPEAGAGNGEPVSPLLSLNYRVFSIIDATGKKFPARLVLPSKWGSLARDQETTYPYNYDDYESAMREMSDPRDFVVAFSLPKGTSGLTLLISNPFPKEGQPKVAAVQLGR
jgi:hypothetical protein